MSQPNNYGNKCPKGGDFHACSTGSHFVGCCTSDPCANECPAGNIRPAGYAPEMHGNLTDASCSAGSQFWTCTYTGKDPDTFWGCCKQNPCQLGSCPTADLAGAFLGTPAQIRAYTGSEASSTPESKTNVAAIAGGAAGGGVVLLILLGLLIFYIRRAKKAKKAHQELEKRHSMPVTAMTGGAGGIDKRGSNNPFGQPEAPPMYSSPQPEYASTFSPHSPHGQWQHQQNQQTFVAELPAPLPSSPMSHDKSLKQHRISELPAAGATSPTSIQHHRLSELPSEPVRTERGQPSELESLMPQGQPGSPPLSPGHPPVVSPLLPSTALHENGPPRA